MLKHSLSTINGAWKEWVNIHSKSYFEVLYFQVIGFLDFWEAHLSTCDFTTARPFLPVPCCANLRFFLCHTIQNMITPRISYRIPMTKFSQNKFPRISVLLNYTKYNQSPMFTHSELAAYFSFNEKVVSPWK